MKGISLLGATGSIGTQTLDIIRENRNEFQLTAMSVGKNIKLAEKIIKEFQPKLVSVQDKNDIYTLKTASHHPVNFVHGEEGLIEVATHPDTHILVNAIVGSIGLTPTICSIEAGKTIAIANKETLVTAGHLVMEKAKENQVDLIPVDSEHSAIFQCLNGENYKDIEKLIITASGGSFRDRTRQELENVTVEDALRHPNWSMGAKITIDSATMMNKGLEVIEAHWLFNQPYEKIECLLHRESVVHSMVQFRDGSVIAQLGTPDMRIPIQYALTYPHRKTFHGDRLNLAEIGTLHFQKMDFERFRCLHFAYEAGKIGGTMPVVLNAANEIAVNAFLNGKITFLAIEHWIEKALEQHQTIDEPDLETILGVDQETRQIVRQLIENN